MAPLLTTPTGVLVSLMMKEALRCVGPMAAIVVCYYIILKFLPSDRTKNSVVKMSNRFERTNMINCW